ncbi:hypothetical protein BDV19DRAFT_386245 [Aspergillus venezuelensis]
MASPEIPRCWCKNPIGLNCIRFEHIIPCNICAGSMAPGERAARVILGTQVRCKRCNSGNPIFGWDHDNAMAWLHANKNVRKKQDCKPIEPLPPVYEDEKKPQESASANSSSSDSSNKELGSLLQLSNDGKMSAEIVRRRALETLESFSPLYSELRQALRFIQNPQEMSSDEDEEEGEEEEEEQEQDEKKKKKKKEMPDPVRSAAILECVYIIQPYLSEGEEEFENAFDNLQRELLKERPHANAVTALTRLSRMCYKVKFALQRAGLLPR